MQSRGVGGRTAACGCAECPLPLPRTWGLPCSRTPCHLCLLPSHPGPCLQQVCKYTSSPITRFHSAGAHGLSSPEYPGLRVGVPAAADVGLPTGMGSQSRPQSSLQGFGYSKERGHTGECCGDEGPGEGWAGPVRPPTDFPPTLGWQGRCSRLCL